MAGHIQGIYTQEGNYLMDLRQNRVKPSIPVYIVLGHIKGLMTQGVFPQI